MNKLSNIFCRPSAILIVLLSIISAPVSAELNIEITQGVASAVPIAVTTSLNEQKISSSQENISFANLAKIISSDLRTSGRFSPLFPNQIPGFTSAEQQIDFKNWQSVGVENIVIGQIEETSKNVYTVSFKLMEVYQSNPKNKQQRVEQGELITTKDADAGVLAAKVYKGVKRSDFRSLAHHLSDVIYEQLTGIRGAFSTRIAYIMVVPSGDGLRYSLEVSDADGFNPRTLVSSKEPIMSPSWSPDAKHLAFVSFENKRAEVYTIEIATGKRELISKFPGINGAPAWSPDGRKLALVLSKAGSPKLYLMDVKSKELSQLTVGYSIDTEPTWSKDGKTIYFTSNRGGKPQIYKISLSNKKITRVTFRGDYNSRPMLTPDDKNLIMVHRSVRGVYHIASQDLESGDVSILTTTKLDESPSLSPNGAMVLYGTKQGSRRVLGLVTIDGRGQVRLPAREGSVQEPAWSPFLS